MRVLKLIPVILSFLLLAAHFSRADIVPLMIVSTLMPFLLFIKQRYVARILQVSLIIGAAEWVRTIVLIVETREASGQDWTRMAIILGTVSLFTLSSALIFQTRSIKALYKL